MQTPVNLNKLLANYCGTGLYLAMTRDRTQVIATGKTIQDAVEVAAMRGYRDPIIMRAPGKNMGKGLHL